MPMLVSKTFCLFVIVLEIRFQLYVTYGWLWKPTLKHLFLGVTTEFGANFDLSLQAQGAYDRKFEKPIFESLLGNYPSMQSSS